MPDEESEKKIAYLLLQSLELAAQVVALKEALIELSSSISGEDSEKLNDHLNRRQEAHMEETLLKIEEVFPGAAARLSQMRDEET